MIFHISIHNVPEGPDCPLYKSGFCLTHCRIYFEIQSSAAQKFSNSPWSTHISFGRFLLVVIFENVFRVSFEPFVFIPLASIVPSNMSWRTCKSSTPLLSLANLSTNAKSKHQISFLNLAMTSNFRSFRVGWEKLVYHVFECRNWRTFEIGILLALPNFAKNHMLHHHCIFSVVFVE